MDISIQVAELRDITYAWMTLLQARIELEAMLAENQVAAFHNEVPVYGESEIKALIEKHGVHHNAIVSTLYPGR